MDFFFFFFGRLGREVKEKVTYINKERFPHLSPVCNFPPFGSTPSVFHFCSFSFPSFSFFLESLSFGFISILLSSAVSVPLKVLHHHFGPLFSAFCFLNPGMEFDVMILLIFFFSCHDFVFLLD